MPLYAVFGPSIGGYNVCCGHHDIAVKEEHIQLRRDGTRHPNAISYFYNNTSTLGKEDFLTYVNG
jgi:hypothetical protein